MCSSDLHRPSGYIWRNGKVSCAECTLPSPLVVSRIRLISRFSAAVSFTAGFAACRACGSGFSFLNNGFHLLFRLGLPLQGCVEIVCLVNLIIRDIRETHKKDSESAPQTTVANELKENLEAVENFKGSRLEKLAMLYCKQLGINYKNLSEEEFRWLIRILQKSKKMGTPISQRKKR